MHLIQQYSKQHIYNIDINIYSLKIFVIQVILLIYIHLYLFIYNI